MIDIVLTLRDMPEIEFSIEPDSPLLQDLFQALRRNVDGARDELFRLQYGGEHVQEVYFARSQLIAIETSAPVDARALAGTVRSGSRDARVFAAPFLQFLDFLPSAVCSQLLEMCVAREAEFTRSSVLRADENYRRSVVLHDLGGLREPFESRLRALLPEAAASFELGVDAGARLEIHLTASRDGDYFRRHADNADPKIASRVVTFVYYFHSEPKAYTGGELRLYDYRITDHEIIAAESFRQMAPRHNQLILFPSNVTHEVMPVASPSDRFVDSRFTVNGWVHGPAQGGTPVGPGMEPGAAAAR